VRGVNKSFFGSLLLLPLIAAGCQSLDPRQYPTAKEWHDEHHDGDVSGLVVAGTNRTTPVAWHRVRMDVYDLPRPHWHQKINPAWWFKNSADPLPPDWYRPGKRTRKMTWYVRNPFHNFDYYVIGVADHKTVRCGRYPENNMNPNGGWNFAATAYKRLRLPFVSYEGRRIRFYLGWRESGDFGLKFNIKKKRGKG
jgi:hypothetical protein